MSTRPSAARKPAAASTKVPEWQLKLYVAGQTAKSVAALQNLQRVCETHLAGRYHIEVVDLSLDPAAASAAQVIAAPTLVKNLPPPQRRFIGDMSDTHRILAGLNIPLGAGIDPTP